VRRRNGDLLLAVVVAAAAAEVVNLVPSVAVRTAFALPLVFVTPGYCLTAAVFNARSIDGVRRTVLTLGSSVSVAILSALVLDRLPVGLHTVSWTVVLVAVTWVAAAVAKVRREIGPQRVRTRWRVRPIDAVLIVAAALLAAGAVAFARTPLPAGKVRGYTALWIQPAPEATTPSVRVGIESAEMTTVPFRLDLRVGSSVLYRRRITLAPGQRWEQAVRVQPLEVARNSPIQARLYRVDRSPAVYRLVRLGPGRVVARP
jgi:uncharacterized membrane protein